jgi:hypothetical protein
LVLLSHAGHGQEWRNERDSKDVFDSHDFSSAIIKSTTLSLQLSLHRFSSKRRENASFLGFDEIVLPAARARAASPSKGNHLQISLLADRVTGIG